MKLRMNRNSPAGDRVDVYLNGEKVERAFEADEKKGIVWVDKQQPPKTGKPTDIEFLMDGLPVIAVKGDVEIRPNGVTRSHIESLNRPSSTSIVPDEIRRLI